MSIINTLLDVFQKHYPNFDNIFDVMKDVEDNYQLYWNKIFGNDNLYRLLLKMEDDNINNIKNRLC